MRIGILGSGTVALTLAGKLVELGHEVMVSSRDVSEAKEGPMGKLPAPADWAEERGENASAGSFAEAAAFGEVLFNCTAGAVSLQVLETVGPDALAGKVLVDVANALDFSQGMPPTLTVANTGSLAEEIQEAYPDVKVVKALNTVNSEVMVDPSLVPGESDLFVAGNDAEAKAWVTETLLKDWFGWSTVHDLGTIQAARGLEMYVILWVAMMGAFETTNFNVRVVK